MKDQITGTAVLDRAKGQLAVECTRADGRKFQEVIPIYFEGQPKPAENAWLLRPKDGVLHATPSLHCKRAIGPDQPMTTYFHNEYAWSVAYVELPPYQEIGAYHFNTFMR